MTKVRVEYDEVLCDECGMRWASSCEGCEKDLCAKCQKEAGWKDYSGYIHGNGRSMVLCPTCLLNPPEHLKELTMAYQTLQALQDESERFYEEWSPKAKVAEKRIKVLRGR